MNGSPVSSLNKAVFDRMKSKLNAPIFDYIPVGKKAPYVVLTDTTAQEWNTKTTSGAEVMATIKIISEYQGDKEVAELADAIIFAIRTPVLVLTGDWQVVLASLHSHSVDRLETYREATIQFKFLMVNTKE